jgi:N-acetylmuramoyl-L-alanine amidase
MKKYLIQFWPLYLTCILFFTILAVSVSRTVTTMAQNAPVRRNIVFVIDAGHGGEDGGATSCSGALESKINLQIALRLNDLLHLLGYDTIMVRSSDISVYTEGQTIAARKLSDLKQRVRIVNQAESAILVSIHQNFFGESRYYGAQVFYNRISGAQEMANSLQTTLVSALNPGSKRQCKPAENVYLMEHIRHPGLLIECGFISNPEEEAKLRNEDYQKKICCVIATSLSNAVN